jgi:hypothetical protein
MKWSTLAIGLAFTVALAAPVIAQQSLGDVAGSIKLKRPEGESVVIDGNSVAQSRRRTTGRTDVDLLRDVVGDCLAETTALRDLVEETRDGTSFYRDPWRNRVEEVGFLLDGALEELGLIRVDARYQEAYDLAGRGAFMAGDALEILQSAIAEDRPVFSESKNLSREAVRFFEEAQSALRAAMRADAAEKDAPSIDPVEANRVMTALCGGQYGVGSSGFDICVAEQRAAVDAMTGRFPLEVGLNAAVFNVIRHNCRFEWSDNFVKQDRCERNRIAAKKARQ